MALIDYVRDERARDVTAEAVGGDDADGGGAVSLFLAVLANNPEVAEARVAYTGTLRFGGNLEPELKELAHVVVDQANECAYCTASHTENLVEVHGFPRGRVEALREREMDSFDEREQAVIRFAEQVATDPKRVTADHVDSLRAVGFDDADVIELLALVASAVSANTIVDALNVHPADRGDDLESYL